MGFDYAYLARDDVKSMPMLVAKDREMGEFMATYVPSKGRDDYALRKSVAWLRGLAYKRLVCRSDNERALLALLEIVQASLL